jgi:predicted O-methyltransferase YrrM
MNPQQRWSAVDDYTEGVLIGADPALDAALVASERAKLPSIAVTASQGRLLSQIALLARATRILEIGALGGYSTIWLARALPPGGMLVTLELDAECARVAVESVARAGLSDRVELRQGLALESLAQLRAEGAGPFEMVFIDADKVHTPDYFEAALQMMDSGGVIVADNVVLDGTLIDPDSDDPRVPAVRRFHELAAADPRVTATTIQTVGRKGYDGFTLALVDPA